VGNIHLLLYVHRDFAFDAIPDEFNRPLIAFSGKRYDLLRYLADPLGVFSQQRPVDGGRE
jgi:hypothetical protein